MNFISWANNKIKKFDWLDITLIKIGVFVFALMVVKLWMPIVTLDWYWYAIIFVLVSIRTALKLYRK